MRRGNFFFFFFGSGVFESDQLGDLSPSNQCPANCRVCVEIAPLRELGSSMRGLGPSPLLTEGIEIENRIC